MLDVLIGARTEPLGYIPLIAWFKGGMAYRQLQTDRIEVNNLNEFEPEIQFGLGYRINEQATFNIGYQRIWGKPAELTVDPNTEIGVLRYIPSQQSILMGITLQYF